MRSITFTDDVLLGLSKRPDIRNMIPGLNSVEATAGSCCAGRHKKTNRSLSLVKEMVANLSPENIAALKQKLDVDVIVVYVKTRTGVEKREL